jgi:hypothetical protein
MVMVVDADATREVFHESCACTVAVNDPNDAGVPEMMPVAEPIVTPLGSEPDAIDQIVDPTCPADDAEIWNGRPTPPVATAGRDMLNAGGSTAIVNALLSAHEAQFESDARTVNVTGATAAGVQSMTPFELRDIPAGSGESADHTMAPVPPVAVSVARYVEWYVPFGSDNVVIVSVTGATVMFNSFASDRFDPQLSVPCTATLNVPHAVGVPLIDPVAGLNVKPFGSAPVIDHDTVPTLPLADGVT